MEILLSLVALGFSLVGLACNIIILVDAFRKSVGTGFLCLCVPCYILYYMFTQFEHPQKNLIIAGSLGGTLVANAINIGLQGQRGGGY